MGEEVDVFNTIIPLGEMSDSSGLRKLFGEKPTALTYPEYTVQRISRAGYSKPWRL